MAKTDYGMATGKCVVCTINLWDSTGVDLIDIDQWHGEPNDKKLEEAFVTIYKFRSLFY